MTQNHDDMVQSLEQVYARALLEAAQEAGTIDEVADEMQQLAHLLTQQPRLVRLLSTRMLSVEQRARSIENLFKGRVGDLVYRFLQVANAKHRLDRIQGIVRAVAQLVDERRGIVRVDAYVADRMDAAAAERVAQRLGEVIGGRVVLRQHEDPQLIGGLKLRVGDRLVDGSVAAQLRLMHRKIVATGRGDTRQKLESLISED